MNLECRRMELNGIAEKTASGRFAPWFESLPDVTNTTRRSGIPLRRHYSFTEFP